MKRMVVLTAVVAALTTAMSGSMPAGATTDQPASDPAALKAVVVKDGLANPAGFTFLPDGRILYGERNTGRVMLLNPKTGKDKLMYTVTNIRSSGEQGLLGLAVDPKWPKRPFVYAYATRQVSSLQNQILKIKVDKDKGVSRKIIWRLDTVAGTYHDGGHIDFGPDNKLYAVVGEGHSSSRAQDLTNDAGKVLRMNRNGTPPKDNPFDDSRIFTYGLRNSFGFAFDPQSGTLWETENGPECVDEINVEEAGENHAWGSHETCSGTPPENVNQDGPEPRIMPLAWFTPTIAPTGLAFCEGCGISSAEGALFFGANNTGEIRQINLTADRKGVDSMSVVYDQSGAVLSMQRAPKGGVYFSTSNSIYHLVEE
jgi:glucose/arabinose dehydrogenase